MGVRGWRKGLRLDIAKCQERPLSCAVLYAMQIEMGGNPEAGPDAGMFGAAGSLREAQREMGVKNTWIRKS